LGKSSAVASWQNDFCLLFKLIKIFSVCLAWEQYKLGQVRNSKLVSEWLHWRNFKWTKNTSKNTNRALRDTNGNKTTVLLSHL